MHAVGALAGKCYTSTEPEYIFDVCLFSRATQRPRAMGLSARTVHLGKQWRWAQEGSRGLLSNGDPCPMGTLRSLSVLFECGLTEELGRVREPAMCTYTTTLST